MVSAVVVTALDKWWNPEDYELPEQFNTVTDRLMDWHNDELVSDVVQVKDKYADYFWRGTTDVREYKPEARRQDTFMTLSGLRVYPGFDHYGNRIMRHYKDSDNNITVRISVVHSAHGNGFVAESYANRKVNGKWRGQKMSEYRVKNAYCDISEQRITYWSLMQFEK